MSDKRICIYGNLCNKCGHCIQACPSDAMTQEAGEIRIDAESCTLCGFCVKACAQHAIRLERSSRGAAERVHKDVWVFIEYRTAIHVPCLQVLSKAYDLSRTLGERLVAIVAGRPPFDTEALSAAFSGFGVDEVRALGSEQLASYQPEDIAEVLRGEIQAGTPRIVLFLGSYFGRALAPRLAAKLQTGLTADCTELSIDENKNLVQVRPTYGGRILASILCQSAFPQMASVRPNIFEVRRRNDAERPPVLTEIRCEIDSIEKMKQVIRSDPISRCGTPIEEAEVIVCGGLGVGSKEGFALLESLAEKVGGVVAGTREVVDRGWIDFSRQVGQTGKVVRPRLYIGCGVSGAVHHMIGMKHARNIIAINSDPRAPIFRIATVGVVGDMFKVLPPLIGRL